MPLLRTLLTLLLCLTLPYTALASALRDPQCLQGRDAHGHDGSMAMTSPMSTASPMTMPDMAMDDDRDAPAPHRPVAADHCGCLLGCACVQACAAPACNSGLDRDASRMLAVLQQESPPAPRIAARRPGPVSELLRPPRLRA